MTVEARRPRPGASMGRILRAPSAHVLIATQLQESGLAYLRARPGARLTLLPGMARGEFLAALADADALIVRSELQVDEEALTHAPLLKVIGRAGIGVDNIDLDRATQRGVLVVNAPRENIDSAAEHTFALLLAVARRIPASDVALKGGRWERDALGRELLGRTLGLAGLGKVGSRVARMAQGFGMEVVAYDPYVAPEQFRRAEVREAASLEELLAQADVVSLHVPRIPGSGPLLDRARIELLKPGAILLNTSRGALIDEQALYERLRDGHLFGAGLDVWAVEPSAGTALQRLPNVVATPHLGASTEEAQERVALTIAVQVWKGLADEPVDYPVNLPYVEAELASRIMPWAVLGEKMGALLAQVIEGSPRSLEIAYGGELADVRVDRLRGAVLKGLMARVTDENVNFVNAEALTREHGIEVLERRDPVRASFVSTLTARVRFGEAAVSVTGTLFDGERPRIVDVDGFEMEFPPEENLLLMRWWDRPGVLGRVGTALGEAGVNVARLELSRTRPGRRALAVISTDTPAGAELVERLARLESVVSVRAVRL
ncbi:MAG: phosphoglycerate dehydrogenase [Gemmatimonadota bacterium]